MNSMNKIINLDENEVKVNSRKFSFVIELTPKSNTEVTIVDLQINVNTRSKLTVSFGNEKVNINKEIYVSFSL